MKGLNRMLENFEGKLTSRKWAGISTCSPKTALCDIKDLLKRRVHRKTGGGGVVHGMRWAIGHQT